METFEVGLNVFCVVLWLQAYGGQGVEYGGLNETSPYRIIYLNAWSLAGRTVLRRFLRISIAVQRHHVQGNSYNGEYLVGDLFRVSEA